MIFDIFNIFNISSVFLNSKQMNRSMCLDKCGFLYRLPGEDFLKDFIDKSRTAEPLIKKSVLLTKHKDTKTDLTIHFDAIFDYEIENFTWVSSGKPVQQRYWAKRFSYVYPRLTTRVIQPRAWYLG